MEKFDRGGHSIEVTVHIIGNRSMRYSITDNILTSLSEITPVYSSSPDFLHLLEGKIEYLRWLA